MTYEKSPENNDNDKGEKNTFNTSPENLLEGFRTAVLESETLQAKVREAQNEGDLIQIAAQHGFGVTDQQIKAMRQIGSSFGGLGEIELDTVLGAAPCWCDPSVVSTKSC